MTPKQFEAWLRRDLSCFHCGTTDDTLIPGHRIDRGHGGNKLIAMRPSVVIVQCSYSNGLQTSSADFAGDMERAGIRLRGWRDPLRSPIYHFGRKVWLLLDDDFGQIELEDYLPAPVTVYRGR